MAEDAVSRVAGVGAGGRFGDWVRDDDGFDEFALRVPAHRADLVLPEGGAAAIWHQISSPGITATAHVGGWTTVWATSRGMVALTGQGAWWGLCRAGDPTPLGLRDDEVRWGAGCATWIRRRGELRVERRVWTAPDDLPVLRVEVRLKGLASIGGGWSWAEAWTPSPWPLLIGPLMSRRIPPPRAYGLRQRLEWASLYTLSSASRRVVDAVRRRLARRLVTPAVPLADGTGYAVPPRRWLDPRDAARPAWWDPSLPVFAVAAQPAGGAIEVRGGEAPRVEVRVPEGETEAVLRFSVVLAPTLDQVAPLAAAAWGGDEPAGARDASRAWAAQFALEAPPASERTADAVGLEAIAREASWHAASLLGARQHDDHFGASFVTQGSAYAYIHGAHGAPRDEALFAVPLAYFDPAAALDQLRVMAQMMSPSGMLQYAHTGRGRCTGGGVHASPTDLPIWWLWAVTDVVWTTGATGFLDERLPYHPATRGGVGTVRDRLVAAYRALRDRVGRGEHGLLRVGSGDWSDPISAMVPSRRAFHAHGESGFNTGFAAYVLPRAAQLLDADEPAIAAEMRGLADELSTAMAAAWAGEWFLRGFDGQGNGVGESHLFLDGQVWAIIAGVGTPEQRRRAVESIVSLCDEPSPIGPTILDRPHPVHLAMLAPGWDCNGGVWAAIGGLCAWAYATVDPALALRSLVSQSFAAHAAAYPQVWFGIWSGPDAYNAHFAERPGETFVQPATPMQEYPVMNANADAGPLLGLLRTLGVEAGPDGPFVVDRGAALAPWRLRTPTLDLSSPSPPR